VRLVSTRHPLAAFVLVLAFASGCATHGSGPNPLWCGLAGTLLGAGIGTGVQAGIHHDPSAGTLGAGAGIGAAAGALLGAGICLALQKEEKKVEPPPPPPPPPKAAPAPAPKEKIVLRGVNFDFDKATIRPDAKVILDEAAAILKRNPDTRVNVDGYTDGIGTKEYNQKLSERRAASVADYLGNAGVDRSHLTPRGFGMSNPVDTNKTKEGRAKNRRVELLVGD
jgi:outer membrane protein OmpA-like peptidoglycan-associated protein